MKYRQLNISTQRGLNELFDFIQSDTDFMYKVEQQNNKLRQTKETKKGL